jgi:hypothetical protein
MATTGGSPKIDVRPDQIYVGIRTIAPFSGLSKIEKMAENLE